jgi:predicted small secreted protein
MINNQIKTESLSEREFAKIDKKWKNSKKSIFSFLLMSIITPFLTLGVLFIQGIKLELLSFLVALGIGFFFFAIFIYMFLTSKIYKDFKQKEKYLLRTILKKEKYEMKVYGGSSIPLQTPLPYPIDFDVNKVKYFNAINAKKNHFEQSHSKFMVSLSNGIVYEVIEMEFVSENIGSLLELHIAKNSGSILSFRRMKSDEIPAEQLTRVKQKYMSKQKSNPKDKYESIDENKADEIT